MFKAILFDLDGTLIDTNSLIIESFRHTFKELLGIEVVSEEIVKYFGEPLRTTLGRYDSQNVDKMLTVYREHNERSHDEMTLPIEGAIETLEGLKSLGVRVGIVTSKRRAMAERGLRLFDIHKYMDVVITPEDTERHKPDGEPALKACEILEVEPEEALFVGDSSFDIACGHNAGMKSCFVRYSAIPLSYAEQENPDYVIDKLTDILSIIQDDRSFRFEQNRAV